MDQGLIPLEKAQQVLSHMHLLFIEYVARRVGFTRFNAVSKDPEFITLQTDSLTGVLQRHGPHAKERSARAIEGFVWNSLRLWHLVAHDLGGRHVYETTAELASLLRQPTPELQTWKRPRLPVPSLAMRVPPEAGLTLTLKDSPPREVTEVYAVEALPPNHQWAVWIHAPIDEHLSESVYLELLFSPKGSFEDGLARAHDMFQNGSTSIQGWRECVRWLAAAMRYLAEGGVRHEYIHRPPDAEPERRILLGTLAGLH
jgi:hypothetical protein